MASRGSNLALRVSVAIIVSYWTISLIREVARAHRVFALTVPNIAAYVAIRSVVVIAILVALLRWSKESLSDVGLHGPGARAQVLRGIGFGALAFVFCNIVVASIVRAVLPGTASEHGVDALLTDLRMLPLWIFAAVVGGGITEELTRAFVLTRFERLAGRGGLVLAFVVDTVVFGANHLYEGISGAIAVGFSGAFFALVYLRKRLLLEAICAHAAFDLIGIAIGYAMHANQGAV